MESTTGTLRDRPFAWIGRAQAAILLIPLVVLFAGIVALVYARFDATKGFDYGGILDYVRYFDLTRSIPLANRGWQMYHPPAYFVATAALFEVFHQIGLTLTMTNAGQWLSTAAWFIEGVVAIAAVRAWRGSWLGAVAAAAIIWMLPGQAMVGSMLYNETMTDLAVGMVVLGIALAPRSWRWGLALVAVGIPLAALSKYSGLAAAVAAMPFVIWQFRHRLVAALLALTPGALVVALYYGRNLRVFGTPVPLNAILFDLQSWDPIGWGHPAGFFSRIDFSSCSARVSFLGGFWKWFFASDCFNAAPWSSTLSPPLLIGALLSTAVVLAAMAWVILTWRTDVARLVLVAIPAVVFIAFVLYIIRVPSATANKGVYALSAIVPLAVATGLFTSRWIRSARASTIGYIGIIGWSLLMALYASGLA